MSATPIRDSDDHPIDDPQLRADVRNWTRDVLKRTEGTGTVVVEFNFKSWRCISVRYSISCGRVRA